ncbi:MAG: 1,4-alpha-glucan branching protein domain-containing protein [Candidatus Margulisiibacteriota bacterium]
MEKGYLSIVLHAHLPFVRHPEYEDFLEEDWYYEAITETYIPLLIAFDRLVRDGVDFRVTVSISPTLLSMFLDPLLQSRYLKHLDNLIELTYKEIDRTHYYPELNKLARMYNQRFLDARGLFESKYHRNLAQAFKYFADMGKIELITCAGTHCFLPLQEMYRPIVRAQVNTAVALHEKTFGRKPKGMWLPECGYHPGDDEMLRDAGVRYFFVDTHGILHGTPRPKYGIFAPVYCKSGVAAFGRDLESSKAVWSAKEGYPGDYNYREFYRDIGFDLDYDYIRPHIHEDGTRIQTGIKYHRITGPNIDLSNKELYVPERATETAADHAGNFMFNRQKQVEHLYNFLGKKPIIIAPYDAELYGHWWYEGPEWLEFLCRKIHHDQGDIKMITPGEYLEMYPKNQVVTPSYSSWGWKGYAEYWLEGSNDWIYKHLHKAGERMIELANNYQNADGLLKRALNQAARELMLAQASDWAFILKTGTCVPYANKRFKDHTERFTKLYESIKANAIDEPYLAEIESKDNLFAEINYLDYQTK